MSIIKKPTAVDSPYAVTPPAPPTRLASAPVAGGGVSLIKAQGGAVLVAGEAGAQVNLSFENAAGTKVYKTIAATGSVAGLPVASVIRRDISLS